jgi:hypothetical protein
MAATQSTNSISLEVKIQPYPTTSLPSQHYLSCEIIFNALHPSIELHVKGPSLRGTIEHVIQETKRDIIYRRMNQNQREVNTTRIRAHLLYSPLLEELPRFTSIREQETSRTIFNYYKQWIKLYVTVHENTEESVCGEKRRKRKKKKEQ